jgi:4-nitrophenyl phosphatase
VRRPRPYRNYLVDVEGVLVRDKRYEPVEGSVAWFNGLAERGIATCLVSNNTTHPPAALVDELCRVGFRVPAGGLVSALALGRDLLRRSGRRRLHWLGEPALAEWWRDAGFELVPEGPCDAVVLGVRDGLSVADLDRALAQLLDHDADLVCLHRNRFWLDATGRKRLGPGAWAAALEPCVAGGDVLVVGKPARPIYHAALESLGIEAQEALFISDDPLADLVTARRLGMGTAFVLSGKYADHGVLGELDQEDWPDVICACPADLEDALVERHEPRSERSG